MAATSKSKLETSSSENVTAGLLSDKESGQLLVKQLLKNGIAYVKLSPSMVTRLESLSKVMNNFWSLKPTVKAAIQPVYAKSSPPQFSLSTPSSTLPSSSSSSSSSSSTPVASGDTSSTRKPVSDVGYRVNEGVKEALLNRIAVPLTWSAKAPIQSVKTALSTDLMVELDDFAQSIVRALLPSMSTDEQEAIVKALDHPASSLEPVLWPSPSMLRICKYENQTKVPPEGEHVDPGLITICLLPSRGIQAWIPEESESKSGVSSSSSSPASSSSASSSSSSPPSSPSLSTESTGGRWENCNCEGNATFNAVVFIGEALSQLCKGRFKPTRHRVVATGGVRTSLVYLLRPRPGVFPPRVEVDFELILARNIPLAAISSPPSAVLMKRTLQQTHIITSVLSMIDSKELALSVMMVSKDWNRIAQSPALWHLCFVSRWGTVAHEEVQRRGEVIDWYDEYKSRLVVGRHTLLRQFSKPIEHKVIPSQNMKLVVVGDGGVGKTSMLIRYSCGFYPNEYIPGIHDNYEANENIFGRQTRLSLWDTAGEPVALASLFSLTPLPFSLNDLYDTSRNQLGQDDYDRFRPLSYPGTDIFVVCFDTTRRATMEHVKTKWMPELKAWLTPENCSSPPGKTGHGPVLILCGTKIDYRSRLLNEETDKLKQIVMFNEGLRLAQEIGARGYFETSALAGVGLKATFQTAIHTCLYNQLNPIKKKDDKCTIS